MVNHAEHKTAQSQQKEHTGPFFQAKLSINEPGDHYEQEADMMADRVMRMPAGDTMTHSFFRPANTIVSRKCQHCEEEEKLHRKENSEVGVQGSNELDSYVASLSSSGQSLPKSSRSFFEPRFGHDFSGVRIHTDSVAAKSAQSINALAYTTGNNIVFNSGQFSPESDSGKRLMAHELMHVVQQGKGISSNTDTLQMKKAPGHAKNVTKVNRVLLSCADNVIVFETNDSKFAYHLSVCDLSEGQYNAGVSVDGSKLTFLLDKADKGLRFHFGYDVGPDQKDPAALFRGQKTVLVVATNAPIKTIPPIPAPEPLKDDVQVTQQTTTGVTSLDGFKLLVINSGIVRMKGNIAALQQWQDFLTNKLSPKQLDNQVRAEEMRDLTATAAYYNTQDSLDQYAKTSNPVMRQYLAGLVKKERCPSCHQILYANDYEKSLPEYEKQGEDWKTPIQQMHDVSNNEDATPSMRPGFLSNQDFQHELPDKGRINNPMHPSASTLSNEVYGIRPYLEQLGPHGFQILPQGLVESKPNPNLLGMINHNIDLRQTAYAKAIVKFTEPGFDYMNLRPIVRELLPLAPPEVQQLVMDDIEVAERWSIAEAILIGIATLGALLLVVFPPTSAFGVAALTTLEAGLASYAIYGGIESYKQGYLYSLGTGANNVFDPEQQQAAYAMMAMGVLTGVLGIIGLRGAQIRGVKLLGAVSDAGADAARALEGVEAQAGDNTIKITGLNTETPQIKVTAPDGTVVREGPLPLDGGEATTGNATPGSEIDTGFDQGAKNNSSGNVKGATAQRPQLPKREPFANDPDFHDAFADNSHKPGAQDETFDDMQEGDDRINDRNAQGAGMYNVDKHHVFPQEERPWFNERGMADDGPNSIDKFTVKLDKAAHQAEHGGGDWRLARQAWANGEYNTAVMSELRSAEAAKAAKLGDPAAKLTVDEIKEVVFNFMDKRGLPRDFVPYDE